MESKYPPIFGPLFRELHIEGEFAQCFYFAFNSKEGSRGAAVVVIPPFLTGCIRRIHAAIFSFWAGVMPPMPMLGRSLL